jgi:hypothetical protein
MNRTMSLWPVSADHVARLFRYHDSPFYPRRSPGPRDHDVSRFWERWVNSAHVFPAGNALGLLLTEPVSRPIRLVEEREVPGGAPPDRRKRIVRAAGSIARMVPKRWWDAAVDGVTRSLERAGHARSYEQGSRALRRAIRGTTPMIDVERVAEIPQLAWHMGTRPDKAFYYAFIVNTLAPHLVRHDAKRVLEIGPGHMDTAVTLHQLLGCRFVFVDLPETFNWGYAMVAHHAPKATIVLPNEVEALGRRAWESDFVFLCPEQAHLIADQSLDAAMNCSSFQEMTYPIIEGYMRLVRRVLRPGGLFYCLNEVAFPFADGSRIEFDRFAWTDGFDEVFHEDCSFFDDIEWRPRRHRLRVRQPDGSGPCP